MSATQLLTLRAFVRECLTAATEEILKVIERTMIEYHNEQQAGRQQHSVSYCEDESPPEKPDHPTPTRIKEERETEPLSCPEGAERIPGLGDVDDLKFMLIPHTTTASTDQSLSKITHDQTSCLENSYGSMKMKAGDEDDLRSWETHSGYEVFSANASIAIEPDSDNSWTSEQGRMNFIMRSSTCRERAARYRARLNADPLAREQHLARRRASYRTKKAKGLIDHVSIKNMSNEAQDKTRRKWRLAKQKQRQRTAGAMRNFDNFSFRGDPSSHIGDQGSPPF